EENAVTESHPAPESHPTSEPHRAPEPHPAPEPHSASEPHPASDRLSLPERSAATRLIVVMRAASAEQYPEVISTLADAGVRSMELTLTTPGTLEALPDLHRRFGDRVDLGVGTITTVQQARRAADGGAAYLVTPVTDHAVITGAIDRGVPIVPGGLTPTERHSAWAAGASAVKVFAARVVGAGYGKDLRGPFPELRGFPAGGGDPGTAHACRAARAVGVSVGGPVLGDALRGGDRSELAGGAAQCAGVCTRGAGGCANRRRRRAPRAWSPSARPWP